MEKALKDSKVAGVADIEQVNKRVATVLDEDLAWAERQPSPVPEDALGGVYAEDLEPKAVGVGE